MHNPHPPRGYAYPIADALPSQSPSSLEPSERLLATERDAASRLSCRTPAAAARVLATRTPAAAARVGDPPSFRVTIRSAAMFLYVSVRPLGQWTVMLAVVAGPNPTWIRRSEADI